MDVDFNRPATGEALDELRKALQNVEDADIDKVFDRMQKKLESSQKVAESKPISPFFEANSKSDKKRVKTSLRMQYEAQVQVIQKNLGDLEEVRHKLGLSKRKICQLLLIDPSAWTRWTNFSRQTAPPHIYRMLEWYLLLQEKHPSLNQNFWLSGITSHSVQAEIPQKQIRKLESDILSHLEEKLHVNAQESTTQQRKSSEKIRAVFLGFILGLLLAVFISFMFRY